MGREVPNDSSDARSTGRFSDDDPSSKGGKAAQDEVERQATFIQQLRYWTICRIQIQYTGPVGFNARSSYFTRISIPIFYFHIHTYERRKHYTSTRFACVEKGTVEIKQRMTTTSLLIIRIISG